MERGTAQPGDRVATQVGEGIIQSVSDATTHRADPRVCTVRVTVVDRPWRKDVGKSVDVIAPEHLLEKLAPA